MSVKVEGLAALDLSPKQRKLVESYILNSDKSKACADAGINPTQSNREFSNPIVQQSIAEILGPRINSKCAKVLESGLDLSDPDKPIEAQRERRMTVETIAKMTGQIGPDVAIGIGFGASIDSAEKAVNLITRFNQHSNPNPSLSSDPTHETQMEKPNAAEQK